MGRDMSGIDLIAKERERQIAIKGWGPEHDAQHTDSELAWAACYYAMPCMIGVSSLGGHEWFLTPDRFFAETGWDQASAKRAGWDDRVKDLVRAGALIAAEIDRLLADPGQK